MTGKVKCTCGWSWNKSDSSKKDMYVCHECGRDNGNNIPKAQIGKKVVAESTSVYKKPFNEKELKNIIKDAVEYRRTGTLKKPRAEANKFEKYLPTKETVDFFKNLKKYNTSAVFKEALKIQHEKGNPAVNVGTDKGLPFAVKRNYNPFTNEINIPEEEYQGNIQNYIKEVSHAGQPLSEVIPRFLTNDIPGYIKAYTSEGDTDKNIHKYVYDNPNTVENYTHKKIQPELKKRINSVYSFPMTKEEEEEHLDLMLKYDLPKQKNGGWLDNYNDSEVSLPEGFVGEGIFNGPKFDNPAWGGQFQEGGKLTFLQPTSDKLPEGYRIPYSDPSSERAMSIGGEDGEPAYLIPSFKYGKPLDDPMGEFRNTGEHLGGPFKTWQEADKWENETRHPAVERKENIMFPQEQFQMGGNLPGAVGNMYARTGAPSKGPRRNQTDVTDASAQNGKEMQYYQNGLDWKPKTISKNGAWLDNYEEAENGTKKEPAALATLRAIKEGKIKKENPYKNIKIKDERNEMVKSADNTKTAAKPKITDLNKLNVRNQTEKEKAAEEAYQDKAIAEQRKATREKANANPLNKGLGFFDSENQTRQNWEDSTAGLESKFRVSDTPNFFDDWINPLNQIGGMAADLGAAPNQIVQQDSMMPLITAIGVPLLTGGLEGIGAKTNKQFVNNLANPFNIVPGYKSVEKSIGKALGTEEGLLSNAYKYNPWAFKSNPEAYYRTLGKEGIDDAFNSGVIRPKQTSNIYSPEAGKRIDVNAPAFPEGSYFNKSGLYSTNDLYNPDYIAEVVGKDELFTYPKRTVFNENIRVAPNNIPIEEANFYKKDWLQGYKEVPKQEDGGIIKDDRGQWDHPGEITEIGSNEITMQGVPYDVLGVSDTGDTKLMKPGKNYKFKGKKVTEYPMAKNGVNQQDQKTLQQLDQLTNFTNYNKPQPGGWLNKYKS